MPKIDMPIGVGNKDYWFNKTLFAGARWGTNIFQMVAFLIKHKAFKGFKLTKKGYSDLNVGILLYNVGG